jgi:hypothetical protein
MSPASPIPVRHGRDKFDASSKSPEPFDHRRRLDEVAKRRTAPVKPSAVRPSTVRAHELICARILFQSNIRVIAIYQRNPSLSQVSSRPASSRFERIGLLVELDMGAEGARPRGAPLRNRHCVGAPRSNRRLASSSRQQNNPFPNKRRGWIASSLALLAMTPEVDAPSRPRALIAPRVDAAISRYGRTLCGSAELPLTENGHWRNTCRSMRLPRAYQMEYTASLTCIVDFGCADQEKRSTARYIQRFAERGQPTAQSKR